MIRVVIWSFSSVFFKYFSHFKKREPMKWRKEFGKKGIVSSNSFQKWSFNYLINGDFQRNKIGRVLRPREDKTGRALSPREDRTGGEQGENKILRVFEVKRGHDRMRQRDSNHNKNSLYHERFSLFLTRVTEKHWNLKFGYNPLIRVKLFISD